MRIFVTCSSLPASSIVTTPRPRTGGPQSPRNRRSWLSGRLATQAAGNHKGTVTAAGKGPPHHPSSTTLCGGGPLVQQGSGRRCAGNANSPALNVLLTAATDAPFGKHKTMLQCDPIPPSSLLPAFAYAVVRLVTPQVFSRTRPVPANVIPQNLRVHQQPDPQYPRRRQPQPGGQEAGVDSPEPSTSQTKVPCGKSSDPERAKTR